MTQLRRRSALLIGAPEVAPGALAVFVPLWPALMAQHNRLKQLEIAHRTRVQIQQMDIADQLGNGGSDPIPHRLPE